MGKPSAKQIVTWVDGGKFKETTFSWDEVCQLCTTRPLMAPSPNPNPNPF